MFMILVTDCHFHFSPSAQTALLPKRLHYDDHRLFGSSASLYELHQLSLQGVLRKWAALLLCELFIRQSLILCTILFTFNVISLFCFFIQESSIHYVNGFLQLKIYSMCFLPVCLMLRLLLVNWPIYLYTFTLLGSPFIILFGLAVLLLIYFV